MAREKVTYTIHNETSSQAARVADRLQISRSELVSRILEVAMPRLDRPGISSIATLTAELTKIWALGAESKPNREAQT